MKQHQVGPVCAGIVMVLVLFFGTGCDGAKQSVFEYHRVEKQADAGSAQVSVLFVAPWEEYVDDLQAKFPMNEALALESVMPTTLLLNEMLLDASGFRGRLALPQTGVTRSTTETDTGSTFTRTETLQPGDVEAVTFDSLGLGGRTAAGLPARSALDGDLKTDPMLKHLAALALFQEVKLLNRYLEDAALLRDYDPYVVRLQVSVMPNARKQPYDVYTNFSFFTTQETSRLPVLIDDYRRITAELDTLEGALNQGGLSEQARDDLIVEYNDFVDQLESVLDHPALRRSQLPHVLPLLVTDNLEAALQSRSLDQIRQLALGVSLLYQGVGGAFDFQKFSEQFQSVFGQDLNSLMTVARASDNTLRVRLGAQLMPSSYLSMVPRTHNVTMVLLVPHQFVDPAQYNPSMRLVARTTMTDALTGKELRRRSAFETDSTFSEIFRSFLNLDEPPTPAEQKTYGDVGERLLTYAQANDYFGFLVELRSLGPDYARLWVVKESLWTELLAVMEGAQYRGASFQLPPKADTSLPTPDTQTVLILDDGEKQATVTLRGGQELVATRLAAVLEIDGYALVAEKIDVADGGQEVRLTFPSPARWGVKIDPKTSTVKLGLAMAANPWSGSSSDLAEVYDDKWRYLKDPKKKKAEDPGFKMWVASEVVVPKDGEGSLPVYVDFTLKTQPNGTKTPVTTAVKLTVTGAGLKKAAGGTPKAGTVTITPKTDANGQYDGPQTVTLDLNNLLPGNKLVLAAKNKENIKHKDITLKIEAPQK